MPEEDSKYDLPITVISEDPEVTRARIRVDRQVWAFLIVLSLVLIVIIGVLIKINNTQGDIIVNQQRDQETTRKAAARGCTILYSLNIPQTEDCNDPAIKQYMDLDHVSPSASKEQLTVAADRNFRTNCLMLQAVHATLPQDCIDILSR